MILFGGVVSFSKFDLNNPLVNIIIDKTLGVVFKWKATNLLYEGFKKRIPYEI